MNSVSTWLFFLCLAIYFPFVLAAQAARPNVILILSDNQSSTFKGILLQKYYGRNDIFSSRFPDWKEPSLEKADRVFTDVR